MKLYLTGGTGLLGSYVAETAVAHGAQVVALVKETDRPTHLESLGVCLSMGDVRDPAGLAAGMQGCDAVIHAASPTGGWKKPEVYETYLIDATRNVIEAMQAQSIQTMLYLSTISVHGLDPVQGHTVSAASNYGKRFLPYDAYGRAKVRAEKMVAEAHAAGRIQATVLRPGWMYGPRDLGSYGRLANRMRQGLVHRIGDGRNRIPLVYAGNVAQVIWRLISRPSPEYRVYLYAFDGRVTQNDYLASLARATGAAYTPISVPRSPLLACVGLIESLSALSGYRLPTVLTRYFIHLFASDWSFNQDRLEREVDMAQLASHEQAFEMAEAWYRYRSIS